MVLPGALPETTDAERRLSGVSYSAAGNRGPKTYMNVTLKRQSMTDEGTFGTFFFDGAAPLCSLELPWVDNHPFYSCIPKGVYQCEWDYSQQLKRDCYHVLDVPKRNDILIHNGNLAGNVTKGLRSDVEGCLLVGMKYGALTTPKGMQRGVLNSETALGLFQKQLGYNTFTLTIVWDLSP
jgi:hypothetical protein